jgi:hypothetical protein
MANELLNQAYLGLDVPKTPIQLTELDFIRGNLLKKEESIDPLNPDTLFKAAVYTLLSASEDYERQVATYHALLKSHLDTPDSILTFPGLVSRIIHSHASFRNQKVKRLNGLASWWKNSDFADELIEDVNDGKTKEFELRDKLAGKNGPPGLADKCSSYLLYKAGYKNVAIMDIWALRFLDSYGENVRIPDYRRVSGPAGKKYRELEEIFRAIAKEKGVSPALLHATVWAKMSGWHPDQGQAVIRRVTAVSPQLALPDANLLKPVQLVFQPDLPILP